MRGTGILVLVGVVCAQSAALAAARRPSTEPVPVVSPDGRHRVWASGSGRLHLDGHPVMGTGRVLSKPVWRRDSRAVAFLQQGSLGVQLLVLLLEVDPCRPLVWSLPPLVDRSCKQVFWIAHQRVGVGEKPLVPRVVVSWTATLARLEVSQGANRCVLRS